MKTDELDYALPEELIATEPAEPRDSARLMLLRRDSASKALSIEHHRISDLPKLGVFKPDDLMLVNQTRVIRAHLDGVRAGTGGRVTGLFVGAEGPGRWRVLLESRGTLRAGERIVIGGVQTRDQADQADRESCELELIESLGGGAWLVGVDTEADPAELLERLGTTPLPPYIRKQRRKLGIEEVNDADNERYNTVYASQAGSVAAPTAGLHFTDALLQQLADINVHRAAIDLHVGVGTFAPVRSALLEDHDMHAESFTVSRKTLDLIAQTRDAGGRIFAIGTTTVRAIESLPHDAIEPGRYPQGISDSTRLFIHPDAGFNFAYTDRLMTNFHLPKSTLLALVASLPGIGLEGLRQAYQEAVAHRYRFYSYGDAMLIV